MRRSRPHAPQGLTPDMRVVIDTNVIVSAFLSPTGPPAQLLTLLEQEAFELLVSEPILAEYQRALGYRKVRARHGMDNATLVEVIDDLRAVALLVDPTESLEVVPQDAADDMFFECAVTGGAAYIVSGDANVLAVDVFRGIGVVSPALFLELLVQGLA
jgi:putative PIN family toxin of toxin-antitoxin system